MSMKDNQDPTQKALDRVEAEKRKLEKIDVDHMHKWWRCATRDGYICEDPACDAYISGYDLVRLTYRG